MEKRPPVVGILGHIDHGKSTLLDYIRKTNIVDKEAGGITQHISAYEVVRPDGRRITFLDTPGHEAFSKVRTRGAGAADIAILIVSGEDGVKPQTLEVYKFIEQNSIPFIVAITKMDKSNADLDRTKQSLAENGIYVEGYGGSVSCVPLSAKSGQGVDELLDMIGLQADILDLKADPDTLGRGVVIESKLDPKRGITAVAIIKDGTVSKSTFAVSHNGAMATLRYILNSDGDQVESLSFSSPVQIAGWDKMPAVGSEFETFLKKTEASEFAEACLEKNRKPIQTSVQTTEVTLPLVIKADTAGSLEAIEAEIGKLSRERISPKIILSGVGSINENDIKASISTPGSIVLGFHVKTESAAGALAERSGISISSYAIIYELIDHVKALLEEQEPRIEVEEVIGTAKILKIFSTAKGKQVLGARVVSGKITLGANLKVVRREAEIGKGKIKELQQAKIATTEVLEGNECGALIESKLELAPGDMVQAVITVTK